LRGNVSRLVFASYAVKNKDEDLLIVLLIDRLEGFRVFPGLFYNIFFQKKLLLYLNFRLQVSDLGFCMLNDVIA
jgi:hypothetical protein